MTDRIEERLHADHELVHSMNLIPVFSAVYGSQNYGISTPQSDIDTKLIVVPYLSDVAANVPLISTSHLNDDGSYTDIKDIRLMFANYLKQNINYVETLFTPLFYVDHTFKCEIADLQFAAERIARYDPMRAVKCHTAMAMRELKALQHHTKQAEYPRGYDQKCLKHCARLLNFQCRYIAGEPVSACLYPSNKAALQSIADYYYTRDEALARAESIVEAMKVNESSFVAPPIDSFVPEFLNSICERVLRKAWSL